MIFPIQVILIFALLKAFHLLHTFYRRCSQTAPASPKEQSQSRRRKPKLFRKGIHNRQTRQILTHFAHLHFKLTRTKQALECISTYLYTVDKCLDEFAEFQDSVAAHIEQPANNILTIEAEVNDLRNSVNRMHQFITDRAQAGSIASVAADLEALRMQVDGKMMSLLNNATVKQMELKRELQGVAGEVKELKIHREVCLDAVVGLREVQARVNKLNGVYAQGLGITGMDDEGSGVYAASVGSTAGYYSTLEADDEQSSASTDGDSLQHCLSPQRPAYSKSNSERNLFSHRPVSTVSTSQIRYQPQGSALSIPASPASSFPVHVSRFESRIHQMETQVEKNVEDAYTATYGASLI